ncbi:MAG: hypothetical protein NUV67_02700 [archaeon]|nr:hypothetical protein [archaeon]
MKPETARPIVFLALAIVFLAGCTAPAAEQTPQSGDSQPSPEELATPTQPPSQTTPRGTKQPEAEYAGLAENAALYESLAEAGLENSLVDFQNDIVLIAIELPENYEKEPTAYFVIGLTSAVAQPSQMIAVEIITPQGNTKYSVLASKAQQYAGGQLSEEQFKSSVQIN